MNKLIALILILLITPILGGIYGIVHDQITFTISEEYYTKFKFVQFGLENWGIGQNIGTSELPEIQLDNPRLGVSIIGFFATWWVGMIIGVIMGLFGLVYLNGTEMFKATMKAAMITIGTAFLFGLIGFLSGKFIFSSNAFNWNLPANLIDKANFIIVGSIHNFSYLGGLVGAVISFIYLKKLKKS